MNHWSTIVYITTKPHHVVVLQPPQQSVCHAGPLFSLLALHRAHTYIYLLYQSIKIYEYNYMFGFSFFATVDHYQLPSREINMFCSTADSFYPMQTLWHSLRREYAHSGCIPSTFTILRNTCCVNMQ